MAWYSDRDGSFGGAGGGGSWASAGPARHSHTHTHTHTHTHAHGDGDGDGEGATCPCKWGRPAWNIWTAAGEGLLDALRDGLHKRGVDAGKVDDYGYTCLHYAAHKGHADIVEFLLTLTPFRDDPDPREPGCTPLLRAAFAGHAECCRLLIDAGADVDSVDTSTGDRRTPLLKAAAEGHADVVDLLLRTGANIDAADRWGNGAGDLARSSAVSRLVGPPIKPTRAKGDDISPADGHSRDSAEDDGQAVDADAAVTCDNAPPSDTAPAPSAVPVPAAPSGGGGDDAAAPPPAAAATSAAAAAPRTVGTECVSCGRTVVGVAVVPCCRALMCRACQKAVRTGRAPCAACGRDLKYGL